MNYMQLSMISLSLSIQYIVAIYLHLHISFKQPRLVPKKTVTTELEFQGFLVPLGCQICSIGPGEVEDQGAGDAGDAILQELRLVRNSVKNDRDVYSIEYHRISDSACKKSWKSHKE